MYYLSPKMLAYLMELYLFWPTWPKFIYFYYCMIYILQQLYVPEFFIKKKKKYKKYRYSPPLFGKLAAAFLRCSCKSD